MSTAAYKEVVFQSTDAAAKMDPAVFDLNSAEDASSSPGPGGTRRAGNLWTAEARDDMYRRRENGESWEDICKDYPRRSRHAMQQQYSMMKKQKAIANGTWTTNRRGRKRRNPQPETWPPKAKRPGWDGPENEEDLTEDDDLGELESEDIEDIEESESHSGYRDDLGQNGRPPGLARSITEPVKANKPPRMVSFTPVQAGPSASGGNSNGATPPSGVVNAGYPPPGPYNGSSAPRKRRRLSQDMSAVPLPPATSILGSEFIPSSVMLEREEILQLLERGVERARRSNQILIAEKETQRSTWEQSIQRANRRTSDALEKLSYNAYEHGDNMKLARAEFSETLKMKARDHNEAMEKLRRQLKAESDVQAANIETLARQNEFLKKENDAFREGRPDREKELEMDNESLSAEIHTLKEQLETLETAAKEQATKAAITQVTEQQQQHQQSSDLAGRIQALNRPLQYASEDVSNGFAMFSAKISEVSVGVEDMNHKQIVKAMSDILEERGAFEKKLADMKSPLNELKSVLSSINSGATKDSQSSDNDTIMQEAPRTPPADQPLPVKPEKPEINGVNAYPHLPSVRMSVPEGGK